MKKLLDKSITKKIQAQIQMILENSELKNFQDNSTAATEFQITTDLSQIDSLSIGLPAEMFKRVSLLFSRMSVYFESGMLLYQQDGHWRSQSAFKKGEFYPILPDEKKLEINIPPMSLDQIQKLNAEAFLKKVSMADLIPSSEATGLVIKPHPDFVFVLFSELPDVWLKQQIELIHKKLLLILTDD